MSFKKLSLIAVTAGSLVCTSAFAGSFQLWNQTGRSVGNAMAGEGAIANDATTAWYNSAGLTELKHQEVAVSGVGFYQRTKFKGTITATGVGSYASTGTSDYSKFSVMPTLQYAAPLNDKWAVGLALDSPYGAAVDFKKTDPIKYAVINNDIATYDIAPSIAYKVSPKFSVGLGPDIMYAKATLESATYFGDNDNPPISHNEATEWKLGYHLSALWKINPTTRVGFNYLSKFVIHATGDSKSDIVGGGTNKQDLKARAVLPPAWTISAFHQLNSSWDLLGTVEYVQWAQFNTLTLKNAATPVAGGTARVDRPEHYHNSWLVSAGANYHYTPKWTLSGALGFDESPSKEKYRNPATPDNDRIVLALGAGYHVNKHLSFDAGYTHFFINKAHTKVNKNDVSETWAANGDIWQHVDIVALQANWQFS